jgi:hypothetical protein
MNPFKEETFPYEEKYMLCNEYNKHYLYDTFGDPEIKQICNSAIIRINLKKNLGMQHLITNGYIEIYHR